MVYHQSPKSNSFHHVVYLFLPWRKISDISDKFIYQEINSYMLTINVLFKFTYNKKQLFLK